MKKNNPLIIAHRGASGEAPENTLAAFRLALEQGSDGIELDVHLSKDGHLIVIHDDNIKRTTNGEGLVGDLTLAELKKVDAGSWFDKKFSGEKIPLLEEVLNMIPEHIFVNVEIKNIPSYYEGIEKKLLDLVIGMNRLHQVIVSSFDHQSLYRLKKQNKHIKIGLLYAENVVDPAGFADFFGFPIFSIHPHFQAIHDKDIERAVMNDLKVFPWTVNSESDMKKLINSNVSGMITNYPSKMRKVLYNS